MRFYISTYLIKELTGSKDRIESLAFALLIKGMYRSSCLHYNRDRGGKRNYRGLSKLFRMGHIKLRRLLTDGIKYGYLKVEGDYIFANPVKTMDYHNFKFEFDKDFKFNEKGSHDKIVRKLRETMVILKLDTNKYLKHTQELARENLLKGNSKVIKAQIRTRERAKKYGLKYNNDVHDRCAYITWSKFLAVSRTTAIEIINDMVGCGYISKKINLTKIDIDTNLSVAARKAMTEDIGGFIVYVRNTLTNGIQAYYQQSNSYTLNINNIISYLNY